LTSAPSIWALIGARPGDNNQVLALAEALGLPYEVKPLRYNRWRHLGPQRLGATLRSVTSDCRAAVGGDPPDLIIAAGHRSVPVVQFLRRSSGRRMRSVHIGYPRIPPERFDLVIATPEYPVPDSGNVMRIPFALTRNIPAEPFTALLAPRRLLILGGPTLYWRFDRSVLLGAVKCLIDAAADNGGSLIVVASPRTPSNIFADVERTLRDTEVPTLAVPVGGAPSYAALLAGADQLFVTADSVAMVSDAIITRKPVGMVPIVPTALGSAYSAMLGSGIRMRPRDLRFFWKALAEEKLVGTVDQPRSGSIPDLNAGVVARVTGLLSLG